MIREIKGMGWTKDRLGLGVNLWSHARSSSAGMQPQEDPEINTHNYNHSISANISKIYSALRNSMDEIMLAKLEDLSPWKKSIQYGSKTLMLNMKIWNCQRGRQGISE